MDIRKGDTVTLLNGTVGMAASGIANYGVGDLISFFDGSYYLPLHVESIQRVERDGRVVWDADVPQPQQMAMWG